MSSCGQCGGDGDGNGEDSGGDGDGNGENLQLAGSGLGLGSGLGSGSRLGLGLRLVGSECLFRPHCHFLQPIMIKVKAGVKVRINVRVTSRGSDWRRFPVLKIHGFRQSYQYSDYGLD